VWGGPGAGGEGVGAAGVPLAARDELRVVGVPESEGRGREAVGGPDRRREVVGAGGDGGRGVGPDAIDSHTRQEENVAIVSHFIGIRICLESTLGGGNRK